MAYAFKWWHAAVGAGVVGAGVAAWLYFLRSSTVKSQSAGLWDNVDESAVNGTVTLVISIAAGEKVQLYGPTVTNSHGVAFQPVKVAADIKQTGSDGLIPSPNVIYYIRASDLA